MLENNIFNIWIFGAGYWAKILIPKIVSKFPQIKIYIIDDIQENAELIKIKFNQVEISSKINFNSYAKSGDICFVLTPPESHASVIASVLDKKCHCWVEKPFTINPNDAVHLYDLAKLNKCVLFVDHTFTFDPLIKKLKEETIESKIQNIISIRHGWGKVLKKYGVLWDLLPHDLSIINFVFGEIVYAEVINETRIFVDGINTTVFAEIKIQTDKLTNILVSLSCISKTKLREIQVFSEPNLLTYSLTPTGSNLEILKYSEIPGASTITAGVNLNMNFENESDSLLNALGVFQNYIENNNLESNLNYANKEVEIIYKLVEFGIYHKSN
jgi:predicted dehydrogenase